MCCYYEWIKPQISRDTEALHSNWTKQREFTGKVENENYISEVKFKLNNENEKMLFSKG